MTRCVFTRLANRDLEEIGDYIARDNPVRALSFIRELRTRCEHLTDQPLTAPLRPEFGEGVRMLPHGRYLICYTVRHDLIRIERVLHSARNPSDL
ncbi:MAG: type II toxin-antitoxin system RelE/ParE family toxin [Pseudomonadota bacterium]|nr:type II toxin-antitoxin system RelE/ParE family toxin [Pseudomonadota bacterium]MDP1902911.1 type II toxin-antitoxin system RelE/ParE family toxin [Pseudomonadota bacterium]MDP2353010.1 type II toxin-antitoxin system RelE/ParE family toxin [Pseudomonadota bacterium]